MLGEKYTAMHTNDQLELRLDRRTPYVALRRRRLRAGRAQWWFEQMRQAVNEALDWQPPRQAPAQQIWLGLPTRNQRRCA